jgi:uncharacterized protein
MATSTYPLFDADVHHTWASMDQLNEYLPESGRRAPLGFSGYGVPHVDGSFRLDARPEEGGLPGSSPEFVVRDHLDRHDVEWAILSCGAGAVFNLSVMHDIDHAIELQRAVNDWTVAEWLPVDDRFLASVHVATSDPVEAAAEIRRLAQNPRVAQVCVTGFPTLMGNERFHPIYEACAETGLPLTYHVGNEGNSFPSSTYVEVHVEMCFAAFSHLTNLVLSGTLAKFPQLRVVFNEFGAGWVPFVMWRMDAEYRASRDEVPWLTRLPSTYVADQVRFTTQPMEEPTKPSMLAKFLELFPAESMLIYSSDYPHWDADAPEYALRYVPEEMKPRIFGGNALETYRVPSRDASSRAPVGAA